MLCNPTDLNRAVFETRTPDIVMPLAGEHGTADAFNFADIDVTGR